MGNIFYLAYSLIFIYLFQSVYRLAKKKNVHLYLLLFLMAGLFYDNFISAIGFLIGEGTVLKGLNFIRYVIHAFFTPLLCIIVLGIARRLQVKAAQNKITIIIVWVLTGVFIVLGFMHEIVAMDLIPKVRWGTLNYVHAVPSIPIAAILINIVVIVFAVLIWRKTRWPGLFITSVLMFLLAAIPSKGAPPILNNAGEIIFMYGFLLVEKLVLEF